MSFTGAERAARYRQKKYAEYAALPKIPCECGCGELIIPINKMGRPAHFKHNHHTRVHPTGFKKGHIPYIKGTGKPKKPLLSHEQLSKLRRELALKRDINGKNNPFYGRHHTVNTKEVISHKLSGANHPQWRGGASFLPYPPAFNRKFKRLIRERDGNRCIRCHKTPKANGRTLPVHHIDLDKSNCDPTNLITLCDYCNLWFNHHIDESPISFPRRKMLLA